jgi:outer membrane receptor protein involved in Fe transport
VQTSNGRISNLGFFDIAQVDIMRGPQALFFGKNSPAGVIAVRSNGPTNSFQASIGGAYEFVGREKYVDGTVSGPITDNLGFRVAVRYRDLEGWIFNDARPIANPFFMPGVYPADLAQLPGAPHRRSGDHEIMGRVTLEYKPTDNITNTLKVFHDHYYDENPGIHVQNIGPCTGPFPRVNRIADPFGDCRADNHASVSDAPVSVAQGVLSSDGTGRTYGRQNYDAVSNRLAIDFGKATLISQSGYLRLKGHAQYPSDFSSYAQAFSAEDQRETELSQELRLVTDLGGPINFTGGFYYQKTKRDRTSGGSQGNTNYNPTNGFFDFQRNVVQWKGRTLSGFGQVRWNIVPEVELAAGARYTNERKRFFSQNLYGFGPFDVRTFVYPGETTPGIIHTRRKETNWSPEVTLTWHPTPDYTLYAAYKNGFKSGGFLAPLLTATTLATDFSFGPEKVRGGEIGAKATLLDRRLFVAATAFAYDYKDLQVNIFDAARLTYFVQNAGKVVQRGVELEGTYRVTDQLNLRGAVSYVHNRFRDYVGQCYAYTFPTGATRATATPPPGCEFATTTTLILQQNNNGRAPARSPDWSGTAGFDYTLPLDSVKLILSGDTAYSGQYNASDSFSPAAVQDSFWRFNASLGIASLDDHWSTTLVGRNLSNKYYVTYAADRSLGGGLPGFPSEQRGTVARGREVLLQLRYNFF